MTSHPMYEWNHTHCMYDTIGTLYDITSTLADNTPVFVCHGTRSVYDIICIIYDVTHTVCMTTQALYLTWNPLKLPSHPLCMSSHPLCRRHLTYCVRHHRWHMHAMICIYMTSYPHFMTTAITIYDITCTLYITCIIYGISSTLYDVTFTMCVTSHNDSICDIKHSMFVTYSFIWHHAEC